MKEKDQIVENEETAELEVESTPQDIESTPKQTPRSGEKTRAAAKGIVIEEPQPERRSKFRHDPSKRKGESNPSETPSKRRRASSLSKGKSPMPSHYPRRKLLLDSIDSSDESSSESSNSPEAQVQTFLCKRCVDTPINGVDTTTQIQRQNVDTRPSSQNSQFEELGQQVDTLSEQVDTGPSSQNSFFHNLDSVSTPPPGQVDTLWEVFILKWMGATCQPR
ncbi:hypothetical protein Taro_007870, partial [Colocasia esculenta]|nr:hypothetical protein [Colocasia esculenta]